MLGVLAVQVGLASPAHAAGQRYAAPTGSGTACTSTSPCALVTAINGATSSTEVIIAPGTYTMGSTALSNAQAGVNIHGAAGQPRPVINSDADPALDLSGSGVKLADVTINQSVGHFGLQVFASDVVVERVEVHSSALDACAIGYSGLARDLLCVTSSPDGVGLEDSWGGGTGTLVLRNVTAIATGAGSYGIRADSTGDDTNLDVSARNVIASGTAADLRSSESGSNSESDITLSYSNYDRTSEVAGGNVTNVGQTSSNQTAAPIFADTTLYHEAQSSPTVDKGALDLGVGTADLDGDPRTYGAAVDIGADEWTPDVTPPDLVFDHTPKRHGHKRKAVLAFHASEPASVTCALDKKKAKPCASPFTLKHLGYGKHRLTVTATDLSGNVDPTPAVVKWKVTRSKGKHHGQGHHHHHHHHHH